jgi:hypothetical protein
MSGAGGTGIQLVVPRRYPKAVVIARPRRRLRRHRPATDRSAWFIPRDEDHSSSRWLGNSMGDCYGTRHAGSQRRG